MSEEWENVAAVAKAFTIGRAEARAMSNLYTRVDKELMVMLREAVAKRGLQHFMTHDLIGLGAFNQGWTSAQGPMESWVPAMTNGDDKVLVTWVERPFLISPMISQSTRSTLNLRASSSNCSQTASPKFYLVCASQRFC